MKMTLPKKKAAPEAVLMSLAAPTPCSFGQGQKVPLGGDTGRAQVFKSGKGEALTEQGKGKSKRDVSAANASILVVDDSEMVIKAFQQELHGEGYDVDGVLSGEEAVKKTEGKKYNVVFVDLVMPKMNGIETCRAIKKKSPDSVVVFMTGYVNKNTIYSEIEFIKAGGMNFYLYKPFLEGEILEVTRKALAKE